MDCGIALMIVLGEGTGGRGGTSELRGGLIGVKEEQGDELFGDM
jgi:hypothetical protein